MCTLSVLPHPADGILLSIGMNRDELRSRAKGTAPSLWKGNAGFILAPGDADEGGTWTGANEHGLMGFLLNRTEIGDTVADHPLSRGHLLPALLAMKNIRDTRTLLSRLPFCEMKPFYCLLRDTAEQVLLTFDGRNLQIESVPLNEPFFLTTSGLGDSVVRPYREAHFLRFLSSSDRSIKAQRALHQQHSAENRELSICMQREEARTVSQTYWILAADGTLGCEYRDIDETRWNRSHLNLSATRTEVSGGRNAS